MLVSAGSWIYTHVSRRHAATDTDIRRLDSRVTVAEQRLDALPDADTVHRLDRHICELGGDIKTMGATLDGINTFVKTVDRMVQRHEDHLMDRSG